MRIAVLPGDGIGPEITEATLAVLDAADARHGLGLEYERHAIGFATLNTIGTNYIVRRVTVANASGSVALANVTILTSNDGNTSNAVTNAAALSTITGTTKYQDLALSTAAASTVYSGSL